MSGLRSSLAPYARSMRDPDPAKARLAAREAYETSGGEIVLINKSWLRNWQDRSLLDALARAALGVKGMGG